MQNGSAAMLGRYRIDGKLGEGAMADVYRAHDAEIDRPIAIKVLKPEFSRDANLRARFVREARAAGALSHPNIATIYDVGEVDGVTYIAMELVEGQTLEATLNAQGRLPYERVLLMGLQLASALEYAHAVGIVHRDLKPSNILLSKDGKTAKLLDFGVARIGSESPSELARTQIGQVIGTPRYMSPEQALGTEVDHRSDLFSLGVVLYELITGKVAFPGAGLATLAIQIAQQPVEPIERAAADCPPGLKFIIDKLLAKKPAQRFQDARSLHSAISREITAETHEVAGSRRGLPLRWKHSLVLVLVTGTALFASVSAVLSRQEQALENMAIVSGNSIAAFVTDNAGVIAAENAGLPHDQQDWTLLQAFVSSAANNAEVRAIVISDTDGIVRAANDPRLMGKPYRRPRNEAQLGNARTGTAFAAMNAQHGSGLRFVRPIDYAGVSFGEVDLVLERKTLDQSIAHSRAMLTGLSLIIILVVAAIGYLSIAMATRPIRRLINSLDEAAHTDFALRISHKRSDEFGAAFDAFNRLAESIEPRLGQEPETAETASTMTRIISPTRVAA